MQSTLGLSKVCTDEWSNKKSLTHLRCTSSKIEIAHSTCVRSCVWSHHVLPPDLGYIMHCASFTTTPSLLQMIRQPFSSLTKSETWIICLHPFLISFPPSLALFLQSFVSETLTRNQ